MRTLCLAVALVGLTVPAFSQTTINVSMTLLRTGWNLESFAIVTAEPIQNPAGCPTPDGYLSDGSQPGYSTYYAAALTAYMAGVPLQIVIDQTQCDASRPKLIGINLVK
jgi:hypothetical protein